MDASALRQRIASTLDANADARRQAEGELKAVRVAQHPLELHISRETRTVWLTQFDCNRPKRARVSSTPS